MSSNEPAAPERAGGEELAQVAHEHFESGVIAASWLLGRSASQSWESLCEEARAGFRAAANAVADRVREEARAEAERKLNCGHPAALLGRSVESDYSFCELCEARSMLRDALYSEGELKREREEARQRAEKAEAALAELRALLADRDAKIEQAMRENDRQARHAAELEAELARLKGGEKGNDRK